MDIEELDIPSLPAGVSVFRATLANGRAFHVRTRLTKSQRAKRDRAGSDTVIHLRATACAADEKGETMLDESDCPIAKCGHGCSVYKKAIADGDQSLQDAAADALTEVVERCVHNQTTYESVLKHLPEDDGGDP